MSFNMCSSEAIIWKAGVNVNSTIAASGAFIKLMSDEAESFINSAIRINESDTVSTKNTDVKWIFSETASCMGAMGLIIYDMSGYSSRIEAETMLDYYNDRIQKNISLLRDKNVTTFIDGA